MSIAETRVGKLNRCAHPWPPSSSATGPAAMPCARRSRGSSSGRDARRRGPSPRRRGPWRSCRWASLAAGAPAMSGIASWARTRNRRGVRVRGRMSGDLSIILSPSTPIILIPYPPTQKDQNSGLPISGKYYGQLSWPKSHSKPLARRRACSSRLSVTRRSCACWAPGGSCWPNSHP